MFVSRAKKNNVSFHIKNNNFQLDISGIRDKIK